MPLLYSAIFVSRTRAASAAATALAPWWARMTLEGECFSLLTL